MKNPSIFCWCPTFGRPQCVADVIARWELMEYEGPRELLFLDDSGQYMGLKTPMPKGVTMISIPRRFACFGEKQNCAVSFSKASQELIVNCEDDDIMLPWALQAHADAFTRGVLSVPKYWIFEQKHGTLDLAYNKEHEAAHAGWAYSRHSFRLVQGYNWIDIPSDHFLLKKLRHAGCAPQDSTQNFPPYLINRLVSTPHPHLSRAWSDQDCWRMAGLDIPTPPIEHLPEPDLSRDYEKEVLELISDPTIQNRPETWERFLPANPP